MRHFLFVPLALLAASFCAFGSIDKGLLGLAPADATTVVGVDVTHSRDSQFGNYLLLQSQAEDPHFQQLLAQTGFDPRRDLQSIVFAGKQQQNSFAILARGVFDQQRIFAHAQTQGAVVETFQGVKMAVNQAKKANEQTAFAFLGDGVAALADVNTLRQMIANRAWPSALDATLQSRINEVGSTNDIWFVALASSDFVGKHLDAAAQGNAKVLQSIVQSSGGVKFGSDVNVIFHAVTRSPQDANSLADVIHFMASMVQMQRDSDKRANLMASSLDSMTVLTKGNVVDFAVSMPEQSLEQMAESAPQRHVRTKPNSQ